MASDLAERIAKVKKRALDAKNDNRVVMDLSPSLMLEIVAFVEQQGRELTIESTMAQLQEMLPRWKYFAITESIGAPRKRYWLKLGPAFYSADVVNVWGDTLDEIMAQVRKWLAQHTGKEREE